MNKPEECQDEFFYKTTWIRRYWRPAMAWQYFLVCVIDFIVGPMYLTSIQAGSATITQWTSITLQGGGLYHLAMAAIVGITAWGRSQEKLAEYYTRGRMGGSNYGGYDNYDYNYNSFSPSAEVPVQYGLVPKENIKDGLADNIGDEIIPPDPRTK